MYHRFILSSFSPADLIAVAHYFADWSGTCLLYSGGNLDSAQHSFLGLFPFETATVYDQQLIIDRQHSQQILNDVNPWEALQTYFFHPLAEDPQAFAFGWFGYGMGAYADQDKKMPYRLSTMPDAYWQHCALVIIVDHHTHEATIQIASFAYEQLEPQAQAWLKRLSVEQEWREFLKTLPSHSLVKKTFSLAAFPDHSTKHAAYIQKVQQAQEWIRAGEIYQVNLSQPFHFSNSRPPFSVFQHICQLNPAPFSAYFCFKNKNIISSSPERFLCKKGQLLETRPIKGTIRRGSTLEEDQELKARLLASPKERAELLMITDLMRNDLGRISEVGSVVVKDLWRCEAYTNVFHLLSIICSQAKKDLSPLEMIRASFPGGSITGCPKLRSMEIIHTLEEHARSVYTGSIGYVTGRGDFDLNIAIRTLVIEETACSLQLGSGIVFDSDPEQEYQETLFKGASFFHLLHQVDT